MSQKTETGTIEICNLGNRLLIYGVNDFKKRIDFSLSLVEHFQALVEGKIKIRLNVESIHDFWPEADQYLRNSTDSDEFLNINWRGDDEILDDCDEEFAELLKEVMEGSPIIYIFETEEDCMTAQDIMDCAYELQD